MTDIWAIGSAVLAAVLFALVLYEAMKGDL